MLETSGTRQSSRTAPSTSPTPQPPPETTTMRPSAGSPSARRASSGQRGSRNSAEISGRTRRAEPAPAMRSTEGIDSPYITRCMSIPGCAQKKRPVRSVMVATVGQAHGAGAAQPREHDGDRGVGRDDHVGLVLGDAARERPGAEQAQLPAGQPADGGHALQQPVDERVAPRQEAQLYAVTVLDDLAQHAPHRGEAVDHLDLGLLGGGFDLLGQRTGRGGVALADVGGEDQDTAWAGAPG